LNFTIQQDGTIPIEDLKLAAAAASRKVLEKESNEQRAAIGFHVYPETKVFNLPYGLFTQDDTIGSMLSFLLIEADYSVSTYQSRLNAVVKPSKVICFTAFFDL
jgi:hypothetical protein